MPYFHSRMVFRGRKLLPELSRSASGFRCGEIAMPTQDAESAKFGGKRPPCWPATTVAGIKLQDLSLPPSARCWKPDGSRAHRVFGRHRMAVPLWTALCSTRRSSLTVSPVIWRCMEISGQAFFQFRFGERYHHKFRKESQISVDQRRKFHGGSCCGFSCLWSN